MTTYEEIKGYLEKYPTGRERKNKNKFIGWMLDNTYHLTLAGISKGALENIVKDAATYDRTWRQVLEHEAHLRGSDYSDKTILEQEKKIELGYVPAAPEVMDRVNRE